MPITKKNAFGALVGSRFSKTIASVLRLKHVPPVLNVTKQDTYYHSKLYHEQQLKPEWR
jgi:hypothetical protein